MPPAHEPKSDTQIVIRDYFLKVGVVLIRIVGVRQIKVSPTRAGEPRAGQSLVYRNESARDCNGEIASDGLRKGRVLQSGALGDCSPVVPNLEVCQESRTENPGVMTHRIKAAVDVT